MSDDFSDAPLTVNGVTIKPKWPWSKEYRASVRATLRNLNGSDRTADDRGLAYLKWFAGKRGLTLQEAAAECGVSMEDGT